jgi:hypothetical protein
LSTLAGRTRPSGGALDPRPAGALDPGNENAINGRRTMKAEIARFGSEPPRPLNATDPHPSFDCETAKLAVERAICADPQLGRSTARSPRPMQS